MLFLQIFFALASLWAETPECGAKAFAPKQVLDGRSYGKAKENKLDLYIPMGAHKPYKTIFFIHGGCFQFGARDSKDSKQQIMKLVRSGYAVASIGYRLAKPNLEEPAKGKNLYPAALDDVGDAWCWLQKNGSNYGLEYDHMVAMGYSAGASLATMLGTRHRAGSAHSLGCTPHIGGVVHLFGRVNFLKSTEGNAADLDCGEAFAGVERDEADPQEKFRRMDILSHALPEKLPPFFVSAGDKDSAVNTLENSKALCDKLGKKCELQIISGADHMYNGPGQWDQAFNGICKFLSTKVFTEPAAVSSGEDNRL